jgi:xanthine dehydrogenase accessory factor
VSALRELCLVRGGGDVATGVVWRLTRCGFPVIVTELAEPLTIRRTVAVSTAVTEGEIAVEGLVARRADDVAGAIAIADAGDVPVIVAPSLAGLGGLTVDVVVDARLAKRPLDTTPEDAPLVVALGPGFVVGEHCHAVVETNRGHHLGRVLWSGSAEPDTGTPGTIAGRSHERVVRAPADGAVSWRVSIADRVRAGEVLGEVGDVAVTAPFDGVVRGLIAPRRHVPRATKIADVDPRCEPAACNEISDKALAVGGGVVEAVCTWSRSR